MVIRIMQLPNTDFTKNRPVLADVPGTLCYGFDFLHQPQPKTAFYTNMSTLTSRGTGTSTPCSKYIITTFIKGVVSLRAMQHPSMTAIL